MANRRMFAKDIVETDDFLDMGQGSQALYFHLGIQSDDHGFIQPKRIMRMTGASDDDLKVLIAKQFVIPFDSGVIVIRHFKRNNYLQNDRLKDTLYQEELSKLMVDKGIYRLDTECIQNVSQYRIDENRIEKSREEEVKGGEGYEEFKKVKQKLIEDKTL